MAHTGPVRNQRPKLVSANLRESERVKLHCSTKKKMAAAAARFEWPIQAQLEIKGPSS
jgi:hypothetical protein